MTSTYKQDELEKTVQLCIHLQLDRYA